MSPATPDRSPPSEVRKIREKIKEFFDQTAVSGDKIGSSTCAVYAFFDYDGEPIYVGQTIEVLRGRVGRHLTGRRSDAVDPLELPPSYRGRIIPDDLYADRKHPDIRIARRAATIASLARLISERQIGKGLRSTLTVQAQRLEALTSRRFEDFATAPDDVDENETE